MKTEFYLDMNNVDHYDVLTFTIPSVGSYSTIPFINIDKLQKSRKMKADSAKDTYGIVFVVGIEGMVLHRRVYFDTQENMFNFLMRYL